MSVFDRVKRLCKENNMSISKMEKEIGVARGASYAWRKVKPNAVTVIKMAEMFHVDPLYITDGIEEDRTIDIKDDLNKMLMMLNNESVNIKYYGKEVDEKTRQLLVLRIGNMKDVLDVLLE